GYSWRELWTAVSPSVASTAIMAAVVLGLQSLTCSLNPLPRLLLSVCVGAVTYGVAIVLLGRELGSLGGRLLASWSAGSGGKVEDGPRPWPRRCEPRSTPFGPPTPAERQDA